MVDVENHLKNIVSLSIAGVQTVGGHRESSIHTDEPKIPQIPFTDPKTFCSLLKIHIPKHGTYLPTNPND